MSLTRDALSGWTKQGVRQAQGQWVVTTMVIPLNLGINNTQYISHAQWTESEDVHSENRPLGPTQKGNLKPWDYPKACQ